MHFTGYRAIVTCWAGNTVTGADHLSNDLLVATEQGLQAIRSRSVSHGDVQFSNMLLDENRIVFV